jgi:inner membrane protein
MDNLTHSLAGAALAETGFRDRVVLATPTLIIAANVPDVDIVSYAIAGEFAALAWRRGITHGVPALLVWPFVVAALMLGWDRWVRRRRQPDAEPARFRPLLALAALGALTHPALDWLNTYGMRWWLPFDGGWSYGDSVFIIDPWLWLGLGGPVFLARSATRRALIAWAVLGVPASLLVLGTGMVPVATKIVWTAGILALALIRWRRRFTSRGSRAAIARAAVAGAVLYIGAMVAGAAMAERAATADARALGLEPTDVMTGPRPGRLTSRDVIVRTSTAYHTGTWSWAASPRLVLDDDPVPHRRGPDPIIDQAARDPRARHFLTWSRYPFMHARRSGAGWTVRVGDARYSGRGLGGLDVRIEDPGPDPDPRAAAVGRRGVGAGSTSPPG